MEDQHCNTYRFNNGFPADITFSRNTRKRERKLKMMTSWKSAYIKNFLLIKFKRF